MSKLLLLKLLIIHYNISKLLIAVIKNKLEANHKKRERDEIEIFNNCETNKSEIKVEIGKIEENKINSDIYLHNNDSERMNDYIMKENKNIKLYDAPQDKPHTCKLHYYI